uniref:Doublecortin domain-containing protein n=1 Tax=Astatotilapia calliptera TaxID=8154 RepID=A0AAX7U0F5_ASTCA
ICKTHWGHPTGCLGSTRGRSDLPPTKIIVVYRNGDAYFPGRKVVVNPRYVPYFDNFLTSLTKGIEAPFGAVRRLYTATQGHQVHHLDDLQHGSEYVAAGNEAIDFKLHTYFSTVVFTNGEVLVPPARIRIPKYTLRSWENVLAMVTEKVRLRTGAVFRLCTLNGHPVSGPTELENNHYYVAVGSEKFKALPYYQCVPRRDLLRENNMTEGYEIVFNAQNKRSEMAGAAEVQEDRQLKVDLPIDQCENTALPEKNITHVNMEKHVKLLGSLRILLRFICQLL